MKRFFICSIALTILGAGVAWAQTKKAKPATAKTNAAKPKYKPCLVYLGKSDMHEGEISKRAFDSLVTQGLTARDSAGNLVSVVQFRFYYKERNLVEDSVGNYFVSTELLQDIAMDNKLNKYMAASLLSRTKRGDTALFDDIIVMMPDSARVGGKPMTFVIGK